MFFCSVRKIRISIEWKSNIVRKFVLINRYLLTQYLKRFQLMYDTKNYKMNSIEYISFQNYNLKVTIYDFNFVEKFRI